MRQKGGEEEEISLDDIDVSKEEIEKFMKEHKFFEKDKNGNPVKRKLAYKNSNGETLEWKSKEVPDDKPDEVGAYVG